MRVRINKRKQEAAQRRAERASKRWAKERGVLVTLLQRFVRSHYGNPALGLQGSVVDGPTIVVLAAATSLLAMLTASRTQLGVDGGGHHGRWEKAE